MRSLIYIKLLGIFFAISIAGYSQEVIFLHHSTGGNVFNQGNVPDWINNYNIAHTRSLHVTERSYPNTPWTWSNYPYDYWKLWIDGSCNSSDPDIECLNTLASNYDMIIFKHCFPGASILPNNGNPDVSSDIQTLDNYKVQYRALRLLFDSYPDTKFMVWTLAPLHRLATSPEMASRAFEFVQWVKSDWLSEDGNSHPNIVIFDFFSLVAELDQVPVNGVRYCLKYDNEWSHTDSDSHPNLAANQYVGPIFAQAIADAFPTYEVPVSGITLSATSGVNSINSPGGTLQLLATVAPDNATNTSVTWSLQNGTGQASISDTGLVTAIADGTVTAIATSTDGSGISGSLVIDISGQTVAVTSITVTGEGGANTITTIEGTLQLLATVAPAHATNSSVTWSLQNGTGQASISDTGLVTAIADGTVTAIATSTDGSGVSGSLVITISADPVLVSAIAVYGSNQQTSIESPDSTLQLHTNIQPENASDKTVTWSVQNGTGQASISEDGLLTAISYGEITARATANDGSGIYGILTITIDDQNLPVYLEINDIEPSLVTINKSGITFQISDNERYSSIRLYNMLGNPVIDQNFSGNNYSIDISFLLPGVYMIVLSERNIRRTMKIFVP